MFHFPLHSFRGRATARQNFGLGIDLGFLCIDLVILNREIVL